MFFTYLHEYWVQICPSFEERPIMFSCSVPCTIHLLKFMHFLGNPLLLQSPKTVFSCPNMFSGICLTSCSWSNLCFLLQLLETHFLPMFCFCLLLIVCSIPLVQPRHVPVLTIPTKHLSLNISLFPLLMTLELWL